MRIMITGAQGSGKTTQAELLSKKLGLPMVGTGTLLREFAAGDSKESLMTREALRLGQLVDDRIVCSLVEKKLNQKECRDGFVVDGYPRSPSQLKHYSPYYNQVFYIDISDEEAVNRLLKRGREDDTYQAIKERLEWYHQETKPVVDYYEKLRKLVKINGELSLNQVAEQIWDKLKGGRFKDGQKG